MIIPLTGSGQFTTTKLGQLDVTRSPSGQSFTTTQLGSSDDHARLQRQYLDNEQTGQQLCDERAWRPATDNDPQLGNSYITRDNRTGTYSDDIAALEVLLQTHGSGSASYSTTQLGNSVITRGDSHRKKTTPRRESSWGLGNPVQHKNPELHM
jgi:hypothetical protein